MSRTLSCLVWLLLASVASLVGCGRAPSGPANAATHSPRIVSLAPHLTELVYTAGAGEGLVGVVAYSDYPPAARELPLVGDAFRIDLERLATLEPDLVLAWETGNPEEAIAQLKRQGYRVEVLATATLADVAAALEHIGRLAGTTAIARPAARAYLEQLASLQARYRQVGRVDAFYQISERPLYTIGRDHPIDEMISICGGDNIFSDLRQVAPVVSVEDVLLRAPDVILAGEPPGHALLERWQRWEQLPAVRNGHLYTVDATLVARSSTRILEGLQQVCERLDRARQGHGR